MSELHQRVERAAESVLPQPVEGLGIAVLIPCYNEQAAIATVVGDFRRALPDASIYVYDNASSDDTARVAAAAGAIVAHEPRRGKGNVVRRMFADIEADLYVLVDGDDTYEASAAPELIRRLRDEQLDMVNAARDRSDAAAYRRGHRFGNSLFSKLISAVFGHQFDDILSGYRILSRRFVKTFPAMASGFEIETELTVHALELRMPVTEVRTRYKERPDGSESKLSTFRDGFRILRTILHLIKEERPLAFFGGVSLALALLSVILAYPLIVTYFQTGLVPRIPTAVLSSGIMVLAFLSLTCGLILDTVTRGRRETKRLRYLEFAAPTKPAKPAASSFDRRA